MDFSTMSPIRAQRRQNTSCDPCRRSKRRCTLPTFNEGDSGICTNCQRLGYSCTFNFAKSRLRSVPKRKQKQPSPNASQFVEPGGQNSTATPAAFTISNDDFEPDAIAGPEVLESWLDFGFGSIFDDNLTYLPSNTASPGRLASTAVTPDDSQLSLVPTHSDTASQLLSCPGPPVGGSMTSPIHLLSSKLDARILDDRLARIYDTIVGGVSSRFLDSNCNLYTEDGKYKLEDSEPETSLQSISISEPMGTEDRLESHVGHMTTLGITRFLDHFSDLYGNRMTPATRRQSDTVLSSVLRTFALQWMPSESPGKSHRSDSIVTVFTDSWFHSRALLQEAQSIRSYRVLYAILLFDAIAVPAKATGSTPAHEFLDIGLQNLCYLDGLVKQYCANLGPSSKYGSLLEASLNIIRWGAYIRDTGVALTADRQCKLPDLVSQGKASLNDEIIIQSIYQYSYRDLDRSIPNICRKAFAEAFFVWRQIINVKTTLNKISDSVSVLSSETTEAIIPTMSAVSKFNQWFRPFMTYCIENFKHLSIGSKTYSVSFVAVWELGILVLVEKVKSILSKLDQSSKQSIASNISIHQREATSSMTRTVEHVLALPTEQAFNLQNGFSADVPIISYHITPSLIATTIQKSIEQIIDSQLYTSDYLDILAPEVQDVSHGRWERQIDILMKGLVSLDVTVGGSQTAGVALQVLMKTYGDIMSECWTCDFDT